MKLFSLLVLAAAGSTVAVPNASLKPRDSRNSPGIPHIDDTNFISTVMDAHWYWRRIHCAQDLTWDPELAKAALASVQGCTAELQHDRGGSNLSGVGPSPAAYNDWIMFARTAIHGWHEEETKYPYGSPSEWNPGWGHFTQLVWRDSSRVGCALSDCQDFTSSFPGRIYCFYESPGNNIAAGEFQKNVWPPVCRDPTKEEAKQHQHWQN